MRANYTKVIDEVIYAVTTNAKQGTIAEIINSYGSLTGTITLQSHIDGFPVKTICSGAFERSNLEGIIIPNTVTSIGHAAFEYSNIKDVTIPDSVTCIDSFAFHKCLNLKNVVLGNGLETINNCAFAACDNLKSITFPASIKKFGLSVVENCPNLESIHIEGDSFEFMDCDNMGLGYKCLELKNITTNPSNTRYISIDGVLYDKKKNKLIKVPSAYKPKRYIMPEWVRSCEANCLHGLKNVEVIKISQEELYNFSNYWLTSSPSLKRVICAADSEIEKFCKRNNIQTSPHTTELKTFLNDLTENTERL